MANPWWCELRIADFGRVEELHLAKVEDNALTVVHPASLELRTGPDRYDHRSEPFLSEHPMLRKTGIGMFQALIDGLWEAGYRPSKELPRAGEIARMEAHLADLQKLIFDRRVK